MTALFGACHYVQILYLHKSLCLQAYVQRSKAVGAYIDDHQEHNKRIRRTCLAARHCNFTICTPPTKQKLLWLQLVEEVKLIVILRCFHIPRGGFDGQVENQGKAFFGCD